MFTIYTLFSTLTAKYRLCVEGHQNKPQTPRRTAPPVSKFLDPPPGGGVITFLKLWKNLWGTNIYPSPSSFTTSSSLFSQIIRPISSDKWITRITTCCLYRKCPLLIAEIIFLYKTFAWIQSWFALATIKEVYRSFLCCFLSPDLKCIFKMYISYVQASRSRALKF